MLSLSPRLENVLSLKSTLKVLFNVLYPIAVFFSPLYRAHSIKPFSPMTESHPSQSLGIYFTNIIYL